MPNTYVVVPGWVNGWIDGWCIGKSTNLGRKQLPLKWILSSTYNALDRLVSAESKTMCKTKCPGAPFSEIASLEKGHFCTEDQNSIFIITIIMIIQLESQSETEITLSLAYFEEFVGLPWRFSGKEFACNAEDTGSTLGSGRGKWVLGPGEGNDKPLQYSCLGNLMDRGAWQATVHGVTKELDMT